MQMHGHYAPILSDPLECKNREVLDERKKQNIYLKLHYSVQQYVCPSGNGKCRQKTGFICGGGKKNEKIFSPGKRKTVRDAKPRPSLLLLWACDPGKISNAVAHVPNTIVSRFWRTIAEAWTVIADSLSLK